MPFLSLRVHPLTLQCTNPCLLSSACLAVPSQQPYDAHGALPDGQHVKAAPLAHGTALARPPARQRLLYHPAHALVPLQRQRRRLRTARPAPHHRVRARATLLRLRLHQRGGHHRLGQVKGGGPSIQQRRLIRGGAPPPHTPSQPCAWGLYNGSSRARGEEREVAPSISSQTRHSLNLDDRRDVFWERRDSSPANFSDLFFFFLNVFLFSENRNLLFCAFYMHSPASPVPLLSVGLGLLLGSANKLEQSHGQNYAIHGTVFTLGASLDVSAIVQCHYSRLFPQLFSWCGDLNLLHLFVGRQNCFCSSAVWRGTREV